MLTQRLFPKFSELQLCEDGANATFRHRDAVDEAARAAAAVSYESFHATQVRPEEMDAIMSSCRVDCQKQITPTKTNIFAQYVVLCGEICTVSVYVAAGERGCGSSLTGKLFYY